MWKWRMYQGYVVEAAFMDMTFMIIYVDVYTV